MGKALAEARHDRIGSLTHQNDGDRLGGTHGRPDNPISSRYHDDIDVESYQFGRKVISSTPIRCSHPVALLDGDILAIYVAKRAQSLTDGPAAVRTSDSS